MIELLDGQRMLDSGIDSEDRDCWNSQPHKTAREVVAAYLCASSGINYPLSTAEIEIRWKNAVNDGTDEALKALQDLLSYYNNLQCPFPIDDQE